jgi:hypothetical protein
MGLDMYLKATKHTYKSEYESREGFSRPELLNVIRKDRDAIEQTVYDIEIPKAFDQYGGRKFSCTAMYWRKANAIHGWFVDNVQDGNDDCRTYYVCPSQLRDLLGVINQVLDYPEEAEDLLPTTSGCFFGHTEYDEYYMDTLRHTQDRLAKILSMPDLDTWSFEYMSSW